MLTQQSFGRGGNGVQPPQGQGEVLFAAIRREWAARWGRGYQSVF